MFAPVVVVHQLQDAYIVAVYVAQQEAVRKAYRKKNARQAALQQAIRQATRRNCGLDLRYTVNTNEQSRLEASGVALVNDERKEKHHEQKLRNYR